MKKLKILSVLLVVICLSAFQTSQNITINHSKVEQSTKRITSFIYVKYGNSVTGFEKVSYRNQAMSQIGNFQVISCSNSFSEIWYLDTPYSWIPHSSNDDGIVGTADVDIPDNGLDVKASADPNSISCIILEE